MDCYVHCRHKINIHNHVYTHTHTASSALTINDGICNKMLHDNTVTVIPSLSLQEVECLRVKAHLVARSLTFCSIH